MSLDNTTNKMRRNESAAELKKHRLVHETIIYNPSER